MPQVIRGTEGRYDVEEVEEFGRAYRWRPESIVVECDCGERPTFTGSRTVCGECGADHALLIREWLGATRPEESKRHPWRYWRSEPNAGMPV